MQENAPESPGRSPKSARGRGPALDRWWADVQAEPRWAMSHLELYLYIALDRVESVAFKKPKLQIFSNNKKYISNMAAIPQDSADSARGDLSPKSARRPASARDESEGSPRSPRGEEPVILVPGRFGRFGIPIVS